jgi:hypothetical protein
MMGEEISFMPYRTPFPSFSASPSLKTAEIPWPWPHAMGKERNMYFQALDESNPDLKNLSALIKEENTTIFNSDFYHTDLTGRGIPHRSWEERISKGFFLGSLTQVRQIFFDQVLLRPDLLEARWTGGPWNKPWNPSSYEEEWPGDVNDNRYQEFTNDTNPGFLKPLLRLRIKEGVGENVGDYKYVVVLTGAGGSATADRFPDFLAHSGAVVMLQESEFSYHFTARLKPWVHYVPIAYNAADVVEKIEWLKAHDHLAQRIASNARNFGKSYLRLEDYYCYIASALETVAAITKNTSAAVPFRSTKVTRLASDA